MANLLLHVGSCSAQGARPTNQDRVVVDLELRLLLVADGMGGQEKGDVASSLAMEIIPKVVKAELPNHNEIEKVLRHSVLAANQTIVETSRVHNYARPMGTTVVVALYWHEEVYLASVGDSRAYLIREGVSLQLTEDHSMAQALVISGAITPEQARRNSNKHILYKYLGNPCLTEKDVDINFFTPWDQDRLVLATDGLTNHLDSEDLSNCSGHWDCQTWAESLVQTALKRGSRDNVTCITAMFDADVCQSQSPSNLGDRP